MLFCGFSIATTEWERDRESGRMCWGGGELCGFLAKHIVPEQMDHINYLLFRPNKSFIALLVFVTHFQSDVKLRYKIAVKFHVVPISQVLQLIAKMASGCNNSFVRTTILWNNRKIFSIKTRFQSTYAQINSFDNCLHPLNSKETSISLLNSTHPCRKWPFCKSFTKDYHSIVKCNAVLYLQRIISHLILRSIRNDWDKHVSCALTVRHSKCISHVQILCVHTDEAMWRERTQHKYPSRC